MTATGGRARIRGSARHPLNTAALGLLAAACLSNAAPAIPAPPAYCSPPEPALQQVAGTPAGPYFVHHPATPTARTSTIVFLPGGSGARRSAQRVWDTFLADASAATAFRIVVPYWPDVDMTEDYERTLAVLDEVLNCYGGDPRQVHIAGFSNGGHAAFDLMLAHPDRFATLLGAPGEFPLGTTTAQLAALRGKAVFNGIGELDDEFWHKGVREAHAALSAAGVESEYVEFAGQGHGAGVGFPKDRLFQFWSAHSTP